MTDIDIGKTTRGPAHGRRRGVPDQVQAGARTGLTGPFIAGKDPTPRHQVERPHRFDTTPVVMNDKSFVDEQAVHEEHRLHHKNDIHVITRVNEYITIPIADADIP